LRAVNDIRAQNAPSGAACNSLRELQACGKIQSRSLFGRAATPHLKIELRSGQDESVTIIPPNEESAVFSTDQWSCFNSARLYWRHASQAAEKVWFWVAQRF